MVRVSSSTDTSPLWGVKHPLHGLSLGSEGISVISGHAIVCWNDRMLVIEC